VKAVHASKAKAGMGVQAGKTGLSRGEMEKRYRVRFELDEDAEPAAIYVCLVEEEDGFQVGLIESAVEPDGVVIFLNERTGNMQRDLDRALGMLGLTRADLVEE
jgi:hypothetical protein